MKTDKLETESTKSNRYTPQYKEQTLERAGETEWRAAIREGFRHNAIDVVSMASQEPANGAILRRSKATTSEACAT